MFMVTCSWSYVHGHGHMFMIMSMLMLIFSMISRRTVYQLSSPPTKLTSAGHDSPADKAQTEILSQRLGVDPMRLVAWNENLRIWITQTILKPLVSELETVNLSLPKNGVSDCKIGESPLDR